MTSVRLFTVVASAFAVSLVAGCGETGPIASPAATHMVRSAHAHAGPLGSPISHVVILIMENRSFDYLFNGFPGANTVQTGQIHTGQTIPLQQIPLEAKGDVNHNHPNWKVAYDNGKMDGFDLEGWSSYLPADAPYSYAPQSEVQPDWDLATQYTLADDMFESVTSNSYPAHQYLLAAQSGYAIGLPNDKTVWGCDSTPGTTVSLLNAQGHMVNGPFPCFTYGSLAALLDSAGIGWRYYTVTPTYTWNGYDAISPIRYSSDWTSDIIYPSTKFQTDVASGTLAAVTWIVPTNMNSDHSGTGSKSGPSYVASVANAIGASQFWNSTALFVVWDDWGGWYDHVAPPQLDRMGLGFRVPMLVVSPWSQHGYVSHVQHEFGSIIHFTESNFGLGNLGQTDIRADDLSDCFNYTQSPTRFVRIRQPMSDAQLRAIEASDRTPPDE